MTLTKNLRIPEPALTMPSKKNLIFDYLTIKNLNEIKADINTFKPFGSTKGDRGLTIFLNSKEDFQFIALVELKPNLPRGHHQHAKKIEMLYVISGTVKGKYWLPEWPFKDAYEMIHEAGTFVQINPGLFHEFLAIEPTWLVELSPTSFNVKDTYYPSG
jgi:quercetin dioxygenase-like cupin family protein